jgi:hypothetical protein
VLTRLKRYAYAPVVALALWAAVLALSPAAANAQPTDGAAAGASGERVVVAPGDSLWSISARWLGSEATAQQVANGVERIYALNRDRIGADPNLLLVGQRLVLPSAVERRSPEPGSAASAAREREVGKADQKAGQAPTRRAPDAQPQLPALPELARATTVPAVGSLASDGHSPSLAGSVAGQARSAFSSVVAAAGEVLPGGAEPERKLLGGALIAISAVLAVILALQVARVVWGPRYAKRRAQKRWVWEANATNNVSRPAFDPREDHGVAHAAIEDGPARPNGSPQKAAKLALARGLRPHPPSRLSANGGASPDALRSAAASRGIQSIRRARALEARRPPRSRTKLAAGGLRPGQARRMSPNRVQRARALRRKGGR